MIWLIGIIICLVFSGFFMYFFSSIALHPGNNKNYSVAETEIIQESPISGKTMIFLGSSVTKGFASFNESFVDYIQKKNDCTCIKEAVSGTTLRDGGKKSYVQRMYKLDKELEIDAFVCQLSTNDTRFNGSKKLGTISELKNRNIFDTSTTIGAIEFIISYVRETWGCPVVYFTNTFFKNDNYKELVSILHEIKIKWNIELIDLYNDPEMNEVSKEQLDLFMLKDRLHPVRAGYKSWWTPKIEKELYTILSR